MGKYLVLFMLFTGVVHADEVYSSRTVHCSITAGPLPAQSYWADITTHESALPIEIVDVTVRTPNQYSNLLPTNMRLHLEDEPEEVAMTVTEVGHGMRMVLSVGEPKITATLEDSVWHQTYACKE